MANAREESYDLLVIGGGVNGAAIARDAAGRGLRVMVVDAGDFGGETSSASSKLIHGGLRYLEHFEFRLVHESLAERDILLETAAHLVRPIRFLMPIRKKGPRPAWFVWLGLTLYQLLARATSLDKIGTLNKAEGAAIPHLRTSQLKRIFHYPDCQVDDARLTLELVLDARDRGAKIENYSPVTSLSSDQNGYVANIELPQGAVQVHARHVVNAAGTQVNEVLALYEGEGVPDQKALKLVRGSHIVLPIRDHSAEDAFTLSNRDGRVIFVIPWLERYLLVGTTDAEQSPDEPVACSDQEQDYLIDAYGQFFDDDIGTADVLWSFAGVRPLVDDGDENPSKVTRDYHLAEFQVPGTGATLLSVYGGKLTTHRALAERVVSRLQQLDGEPAPKPWTAKAPLRPQGPKVAFDFSIPASTKARWSLKYGHHIVNYLKDRPRSMEPVVADVPEAELFYAYDVEAARTADDFVLRRTKLILELDDQEIAIIERWFDARRLGIKESLPD